MNDSSASQKFIPEDEMRHTVEHYLLQRYHEFEKVQFTSCELNSSGSEQFYRFQGKIILQSRSALDRFVLEKAASFYTFTFEINAADGQIINYIFN